MRSLVLVAALIAALLPLGARAAADSAMPTCAAGDPVVWVNTKSKVYHLQGDPYFGKTKDGKYACTSAATAMGAHASGSGKPKTGATPAAAPTKKPKHKTAAATPSSMPS